MKNLKKAVSVIIMLCVIVGAFSVNAFAKSAPIVYDNEIVEGETIELDDQQITAKGAVSFKDCTIKVSNINDWVFNYGNLDVTLDNTKFIVENCAGFMCAGGKLNLTNGSVLEIKNGAKTDTAQFYGAGLCISLSNKSELNIHDMPGMIFVDSTEGGYVMYVDDSIVRVNNNGSHASNGGSWDVVNNSLVEISNNNDYGADFSILYMEDSKLIAENNKLLGLWIENGGAIVNSKVNVSGPNFLPDEGNTLFQSKPVVFENSIANLGVLCCDNNFEGVNETNALILKDDQSVVKARCTDSQNQIIEDRNYEPIHDYKEVSNKITKEATTTEKGVRTITYECVNCHDQYQELVDIPMLVEIDDSTPLAVSADKKGTTATNKTPLAVANTADNNSAIAVVALLSTSALACYAVIKKKNELN